MFQKVEESVSMLRRDTKGILKQKQRQPKSNMKNTMSEMENILK